MAGGGRQVITSDTGMDTDVDITMVITGVSGQAIMQEIETGPQLITEIYITTDLQELQKQDQSIITTLQTGLLLTTENESARIPKYPKEMTFLLINQEIFIKRQTMDGKSMIKEPGKIVIGLQPEK
jgi:hypothetical protein